LRVNVDPSVILFFKLMIIAHIILLLIKPLRRRGIYSFIIGIYISIKIIHKEPREDTVPRVFIYLSFLLIVLCYIILLFSPYLTITMEIKGYIATLVPEVVDLHFLLILYGITWGVALLIGSFHEWMHYKFAMRSGVRVESVGAIIIMGFPLAFFVFPELKKVDDPYKKLVVVSGGIIANAIMLGLAGLLYFTLKNIYTGILLALVLIVFIANIIPYHGYIRVDGVIFLEYLIDKIAKKYGDAAQILLIFLYLALIIMIFLIIPTNIEQILW